MCLLLVKFDVCLENGTWVCGRKIEPGVATRISESDTLKMGNSSRVYKLQWIPKSLFSKLGNPFAPSAPLLEDVTTSTAVGEGRRSDRSAIKF